MIAAKSKQIDELEVIIERAIREDRASGALAAMKKLNRIKGRIWELEGMVALDRIRRSKTVTSGMKQKVFLCFEEAKRSNRRNNDYLYVEELVFMAKKKGLGCPFCGKEETHEEHAAV